MVHGIPWDIEVEVVERREVMSTRGGGGRVWWVACWWKRCGAVGGWDVGTLLWRVVKGGWNVDMPLIRGVNGSLCVEMAVRGGGKEAEMTKEADGVATRCHTRA